MDAINQVWPDWHTVELIGRGAFGEVYKAKKEKMGEVFYSAVKIIQIPREEDEIQERLADGQTSQSIHHYYKSIAQGLMNEIKVLEELKSVGNVVNIEEFDIRERKEGIGWEAFIRMELLQNLNKYRQKNRMDEQETAKLGVDICEALTACEKSRIIHRDIKPANIFVDKYGNFKLGDFGIAHQMENTQSTLSQKGTEMYMAPEVRFGMQKGSYNIDIYALGLVMYRLLNENRMPFEPMPREKEMLSPGDREKALLHRLNSEEIPLPSKADPELGKIVLKACAYDKEARYQSAEEMKQELINWIRDKKESEEQKSIDEENQDYDDKTENAFSEIIEKREEKEITQETSKYPEDGDDIHIVKKIRPGQRYVYVKTTSGEKVVLVPANMEKGRKEIRLKGEGEQGKNGGDNGNLWIQFITEPKDKKAISKKMIMIKKKDDSFLFKNILMALIYIAAIGLIYMNEMKISTWQLGVIIFQAVGLLMVCTWNSKIGAGICMLGSIAGIEMPFLIITENYNAVIFVIMALVSIIGCMIPWKAIGFEWWSKDNFFIKTEEKNQGKKNNDR